MISLCIIFWHLSSFIFPELPGSVVWYLTLIWGNSDHNYLCFFCSFLSFFSFWYSHYVYVIPIVVAPQSLGVLFSSVFVFVFEDSIGIFSSSGFFLSCVQPTNKPVKGIFHFGYRFFDLCPFFWFFLRISISLLTLPICSCMLSNRALPILIMVVLNSWSDNYDIPAMSGSDAWCVSSIFFFSPFGVAYNFFLIARHDVLYERNCCK